MNHKSDLSDKSSVQNTEISQEKLVLVEEQLTRIFSNEMNVEPNKMEQTKVDSALSDISSVDSKSEGEISDDDDDQTGVNDNIEDDGEDLPEGFFDDFSNQDFMDGLDIICDMADEETVNTKYEPESSSNSIRKDSKKKLNARKLNKKKNNYKLNNPTMSRFNGKRQQYYHHNSKNKKDCNVKINHFPHKQNYKSKNQNHPKYMETDSSLKISCSLHTQSCNCANWKGCSSKRKGCLPHNQNHMCSPNCSRNWNTCSPLRNNLPHKQNCTMNCQYHSKNKQNCSPMRSSPQKQNRTTDCQRCTENNESCSPRRSCSPHRYNNSVNSQNYSINRKSCSPSFQNDLMEYANNRNIPKSLSDSQTVNEENTKNNIIKVNNVETKHNSFVETNKSLYNKNNVQNMNLRKQLDQNMINNLRNQLLAYLKQNSDCPKVPCTDNTNMALLQKLSIEQVNSILENIRAKNEFALRSGLRPETVLLPEEITVLESLKIQPNSQRLTIPSHNTVQNQIFLTPESNLLPAMGLPMNSLINILPQQLITNTGIPQTMPGVFPQGLPIDMLPPTIGPFQYPIVPPSHLAGPSAVPLEFLQVPTSSFLDPNFLFNINRT